MTSKTAKRDIGVTSDRDIGSRAPAVRSTGVTDVTVTTSVTSSVTKDVTFKRDIESTVTSAPEGLLSRFGASAALHEPAPRRRHGIRTDGIRTLEDLRQRCFVDEATSCWHWRMHCDDEGYPRVMLAKGVNEKRRPQTGRRAALQLAGRRLHPGHFAYAAPCCDSRDCVNPDHAIAGTKKQAFAAAGKRGAFNTSARRKAGLIGLTAIHGSVMGEAKARAVLASPLDNREAAAAFGVSIRVVQDCRNGKKWRQVSAAPASVFQLGQRGAA